MSIRKIIWIMGQKSLLWKPIQRIIEIVYHLEIPRDTYRNGLMIGHPYNIIINPHAKLGKNIKLYHNVTIGHAHGDVTKCPKLGDNVRVYANATIVGDVEIGDNAIIGANSLVIKDVEANTTVSGNPAKEITKASTPSAYADQELNAHPL